MHHALHLSLTACLVGVVACADPRLRIDYALGPGLDPSAIVRVETTVRVAPTDPRRFFADQSFRVVAPGVGYEVRDFDGSGERTLLISHDAALGYEFATRFAFTLLPPVGEAPPLSLEARAVGDARVIARAAPRSADFAAGAAVELVLEDARCLGATCGEGEQCCDGACTAVTSDVLRCGGCDQACGARGDSCSGGLCRCQGGSACAAGTACCAGAGCVDLARNVFHCGACGKACAPGETCEQGSCRCGGQACAQDQLCCNATGTPSCATTCACGATACDLSAPLCCNGSCKDPRRDAAHCGGCGMACAMGTSCSQGSCVCQGVSSCGPGDACCPTGCAHLADDPKNCGACGQGCNPGETCQAGDCRCGGSGGCNPGEQCCMDRCVDVRADVKNCGACGNTCNPGESCVAGACVCAGTIPALHCTGITTCCPGQGCFDVSKDPLHCGRDCAVCTSGTCTSGTCSGSTGCGTCPTGTRCCGTSCKAIDDQHCASCTDDCTSRGLSCCVELKPPSCGAVCTATQ